MVDFIFHHPLAAQRGYFPSPILLHLRGPLLHTPSLSPLPFEGATAPPICPPPSPPDFPSPPDLPSSPDLPALPTPGSALHLLHPQHHLLRTALSAGWALCRSHHRPHPVRHRSHGRHRVHPFLRPDLRPRPRPHVHRKAVHRVRQRTAGHTFSNHQQHGRVLLECSDGVSGRRRLPARHAAAALLHHGHARLGATACCAIYSMRQ